jgi:hypothetical protein
MIGGFMPEYKCDICKDTGKIPQFVGGEDDTPSVRVEDRDCECQINDVTPKKVKKSK